MIYLFFMLPASCTVIQSADSMFTSPNYPDSYSNSDRVCWIVQANGTSLVNMKLTSHCKLEDKNCCSVYLHITYDYLPDVSGMFCYLFIYSHRSIASMTRYVGTDCL